jgi:hypothetical protein
VHRQIPGVGIKDRTGPEGHQHPIGCEFGHRPAKRTGSRCRN